MEHARSAFASGRSDFLAKSPDLPDGVLTRVMIEAENGRPWVCFTPRRVTEYIADYEQLWGTGAPVKGIQRINGLGPAAFEPAFSFAPQYTLDDAGLRSNICSSRPRLTH